MSEADRALLPLLAAFQNLITYKRVKLPPEALKGELLIEYYGQADRLLPGRGEAVLVMAASWTRM